MSNAIENRLNLDEEESRKYANIVMDLFGFDDRIIDNVLEHEERQLFYLLESVGILNTGREEIFLHDGRGWRIHYWLLKKKLILKYSIKKMVTQEVKDDNSEKMTYDNIYSYLPKYMWTARKL